jgi:hypothetical protein
MVTKVTTRSWGQKLSESIKGVIIGLVLFIASFGVLWWNEGRADLSKIADDAIPVDSAVVDVQNEGNLVAVTAALSSPEYLGDPGLLNPGNYITLSRHVEMYAWVERSESTTEKKVGGGEETTTTYTYSMEWTSFPADSSNFQEPAGHYNPPLSYENKTFYVNNATVGVYPVDVSGMSLPGGGDVPLESTSIDYRSGGRLDGGYLFIGKGWGSSMSNPQVGDIRISYTALPDGANVTAFGKLEGGGLAPYLTKKDDRLYHARYGTMEEAVATLHREHKTTTWILRIVGFLMMWFGLALFFGPINAVLDVLPFLGNVSRTIIGIAMFLVALVLSFVTIVVSMIAHNIIALLITLAVIIGGVILIARMRKKKGTKAVA